MASEFRRAIEVNGKHSNVPRVIVKLYSSGKFYDSLNHGTVMSDSFEIENIENEILDLTYVNTPILSVKTLPFSRRVIPKTSVSIHFTHVINKDFVENGQLKLPLCIVGNTIPAVNKIIIHEQLL